MTPIETPSEFRAAFDTLLAGARTRLRVYDHDLAALGIDEAARLAALRALCVAHHRVELLLDDTRGVTSDHPRLTLLLRDFGHVFEIRETDPYAPRPDHAYAITDHGVLLRPDKGAPRAILHEDDPARVRELDHGFEEMWQRAPLRVSATTLGL